MSLDMLGTTVCNSFTSDTRVAFAIGCSKHPIATLHPETDSWDLFIYVKLPQQYWLSTWRAQHVGVKDTAQPFWECIIWQRQRQHNRGSWQHPRLPKSSTTCLCNTCSRHFTFHSTPPSITRCTQVACHGRLTSTTQLFTKCRHFLHKQVELVKWMESTATIWCQERRTAIL